MLPLLPTKPLDPRFTELGQLLSFVHDTLIIFTISLHMTYYVYIWHPTPPAFDWESGREHLVQLQRSLSLSEEILTLKFLLINIKAYPYLFWKQVKRKSTSFTCSL